MYLYYIYIRYLYRYYIPCQRHGSSTTFSWILFHSWAVSPPPSLIPQELQVWGPFSRQFRKRREDPRLEREPPRMAPRPRGSTGEHRGAQGSTGDIDPWALKTWFGELDETSVNGRADGIWILVLPLSVNWCRAGLFLMQAVAQPAGG